ncbi:MAG: aspartate aminotransferase family protein [Coriobacteriia bacterium]
MGDAFNDALVLDEAYMMSTYARKRVMFVRGEGMRLFDDEGHEYLDFVSGIGAVNLGHAHPAVAAAVSKQMSRLVHVSNLFYVEHRAELAQRLAGLFGRPSRSFFCNSGTEAVEGAIKIARKWGRTTRGPECTTIVTAERSFHGRTLAALSATGQPSKQQAFAPLMPGFKHVPLNDAASLEASMTNDVCAVLLEPIQGEGGVYPCAKEYLAAARRLCDERGALLMLDEVQTGFFRTGPAFAHQGYGVVPDVMTLAKAIANGLPAGAIVATEQAASVLRPGDHGSTFGGGPVVCAAALATIDALEVGRLGENAENVGRRLRAGLEDLAARSGHITDVRGHGLMIGVSLATPNAPYVATRALARGVVLNTIGDSTLRFLPPLVCTSAEVDTLLTVLSDVIGE